MISKEKKKNYITEMKGFFSKTSSVFVTHYQGLSVKQIDELRSEMRKHGILFKITKNRITKLALEGTKFKKLENLFSGPTAIALSEDATSSLSRPLRPGNHVLITPLSRIRATCGAFLRTRMTMFFSVIVNLEHV